MTVQSILMITGTWPEMRCGVGDYAYRLGEVLIREGVRVEVATSEDPRFASRSLAGAGIHRVAEAGSWKGGIHHRLGGLIRTLKPEAVLFQWPTAAYGRSLAVNLIPGYLARHHPRIPLVTTLHEYRYFHSWTRLRLWPALWFSHRLVLVDSQDLALLARHPTGAGARIRLIPIGSNLPSAARLDRGRIRRELGIEQGDFVVAFFGFANPPKGLETLFSALQLLRMANPAMRLLFFSELEPGNAYHRRLLEMIGTQGLGPITVRPGFAEPERAAKILASADCAALPFLDGASWKRGSLLACLAQGLPVVTTRPAAPLPELVHRENVWLTAPGDIKALAAALQTLYLEPSWRIRLGKGAKKLAGKFTWRRIGREYIRVLNEAREAVCRPSSAT